VSSSRVERLLEAAGSGAAPSMLSAAAAPVRRQRRFAGETTIEAKARWAREAALERDLERDPSRGPDGRRLPVRYDD
jgi:hypothetical protein